MNWLILLATQRLYNTVVCVAYNVSILINTIKFYYFYFTLTPYFTITVNAF